MASAPLGIAALIVACGPILAQGPQPADAAATYLDQGWSETDRRRWYTISQGSRLLPQSWLTALEQKDSTDKFLSDAHVRRLGFLPTGVPDGLPLGFVVDRGPAPDGSGEPWVGMTCAACHTGEIAYGRHRLRIDGAPTLADFQTFMEDFLAALVAMRADSRKFDRFAGAVLGANSAPERQRDLRAALDKSIAWYERLAAQNESPVRYGNGRVDALGHILNRVAVGIGTTAPPGTWPADAPASYPFLWTTPWQQRVQWNASAPQLQAQGAFNGKPYDVGAMMRNIGELIGVFGSVDDSRLSEGSIPSSLRIETMIDLEDLLKRLLPPRWPRELPPIDKKLAEDGRAVYERLKCGGCHAEVDPAAPPQGPIAVRPIPQREVGTDLWLACNVHLHTVDGPFPGPTFFGLFVMADGILRHAQQADPSKEAFEAYRNHPLKRAPAPAAPDADRDRIKAARAEECRTATVASEMLVYKAGPLAGIWATAPYLHNGSVPTLYDLLLPPNRRRTAFTVGGIEFDPVDVGFKSGPADGPFQFRVHDAAGKVIPGNDNSGHAYAGELTDTERRALLEYLKTL
jgi:hypothetical protein